MEDGQAASGPPSAAELDAAVPVGAGAASVTSDSSDDTSTVFSVSTSSLSPSSQSCDSSDDDAVAWPEADVKVLLDVSSESDEWELAPKDDDETGEREFARRIPK